MITIFDIAGNWTEALRRVAESVYSFFSYDVATYIAGNLEIEEGGQEEESEQDTVRKMEEDGGEGGAEVVKEEVGERENEQEDEDDNEETDDAMSGLDYDTSTEEDAFEDSKRPVNSTSHTPVSDLETSESLDQRHHGSSPGTNHRVHSSSSSGSSNKPVNSPSHPSNDSSGAHSGCSANSTNKTISSFTVENILMGNTSRSNSTSSGSPTSASHLANNTFLAFPPTTQVSHSSSSPASPASANWTSHPPVKYTKFTMMSPSSMRIGGDKRRKGERDKTVTTASSDGNHHKLQAPPIPEEVAHQASRCKEEPKSPAPHSGSVHLSTAAPSSHLTYHHSVIQSAVPTSSAVASLSRQNSSQSVSGAAGVASPRVVPVSPNPFSLVQTQSPHHPQQQQYVVFFPPNIAFMTAPTGELQVIGQNSPQLYIQGAALHQANGNHIHKKTSSPHLSSSSPSPPPNPNSSSTILSSSNNLRLFRTSSNPSFSSMHKLSEPSHFHSRTTTSTSVDRSQATMVHKLGSKSLVAAGGEKGEGGGRGMPKQKKLRFHMTTVVNKVRRRSSSVSLTAPPPTLCNRPPQPDTRQGPRAGGAAQIGSTQQNNNSTSSAATSTTTKGDEVSNAESSLHNSDSTSSIEEAASRPPHSDSQTDISSTNAQHSLNSSKQKDPTKFEGHLPPLSQSSSASSVESFTGHLPSEQITSNSRGRGRGRGRRSRGYTRRKRELTFHLYEDPYRAKRSRQQN